MGSNKHKHKSRKRRHYRSSESPEKEYERKEQKDQEREKRHYLSRKQKERREKEASSSKSILVDDYDSSSSDNDVIIVTAPPPPKISRRTSPRKASVSPNRKKASKSSYVSPPPPPKISRHRSPTPPKINRHKSITPPPPKISRRRSPSPLSPPSTENKSSDASLSIEETNKLRIKLGLKPLDVGSEKPQIDDEEKKETFGGVDMGDFVHKPPENIAAKSYTEKLKEKIKLHREQRALEEKLRRVKKLTDGDDEDDDDVTKWVEKNRKIVSEKEQAEKRAKELDAMDEVFGIGELIEENIRATKRVAYTCKDLKGLKVEHNMETFKEGRDIVLTLKDRDVLDEENDTLVNVNMLDDERYKKNIDRRRQKVGYNAYEDELTEMESALEKKVLSKYDEEIHGEKRSSFTLGVSAQVMDEVRRESIRNRLQEYAVGKRLENLSFTLQPATEYYTDQELAVKFKKPKKRVRKIRKVKPLKADDLLAAALTTPPIGLAKSEPLDDPLSTHSRKYTSSGDVRSKVKKEIKDESLEDGYFMETDDLPTPSIVDTSALKIDDEDDTDLQLALHRTRKLQQMNSVLPNSDEKVDKNEEDEEMAGGSIILNSTAEFCRTLGDIPTYGQAGNREEDEQELLDLERELKAEKSRRENIEALMNNWNEVAMETAPVENTPIEAPILDAEPDISCGVAGALKMAISKGYIQNEEEKRPSASRFAHLQAQNYSIEDKAFAMEDDKHSRRERYAGPTSDFKEKDGYKPNVKLEYIDDDGHLLSAKEAFRYLSHKFHGKGPGKNKIEKRMKKTEQEALMKQMSSTDTPLGTLNMLQQKQKETQSAFVILSGTKHGQSTNIAKMKL